MVENLTSKFREFIDKKYKEKFSPKAILGYIYAALYHKNYRKKIFRLFKNILFSQNPLCKKQI